MYSCLLFGGQVHKLEREAAALQALHGGTMFWLYCAVGGSQMHYPFILKTLITLSSVALHSHSCRILHRPIRTHFNFSSTVYVSKTLTQHSEGQSTMDVEVYGPDWKAWVIQGLLPQNHYFTEEREKRKIDGGFFCRKSRAESLPEGWVVVFFFLEKKNSMWWPRILNYQELQTNVWGKCHPCISLKCEY